jgi:glutaminyl-tRNA synthetase
VVIDNCPDNLVEELDAVNNPEDASKGTRKIPFSKHLFIERDDFMESPPQKYFRLSPGREVRLKYAYIIKCESVIREAQTGEILEIHCSYDPMTKSGMPNSNKKVKGTLHWVSENHAVKTKIRLYERLFTKENPEDAEEGKTFKDYINKDSLKITTARIEPSVKDTMPLEKYQFERVGYFSVDKDSQPENLVFNRVVPLKESYTRNEKLK